MEPGGHILTDIYCIPTSMNGFLKLESHNPKSLKRGIPIGQYLRPKRNCTTNEAFETECHNLYDRFWKRGYPKKWLKRVYWWTKMANRADLLKLKGELQSEGPIRCICTFDGYSKEVQKILARYWPI